ncbi:MAG: ABC transporter permease [Alphaproteobacteria bacterium]
MAQNRVLLFLCFVIGLSVVTLGFVSLAPNRLTSGHPIMVWMVARPVWLSTVLIIAITIYIGAVLKPSRLMHWIVLTTSIGILFSLIYAAGDTASALQAQDNPYARISLGAGFWFLIFAIALALIDAIYRLDLTLWVRASIFTGIVSGLVLLGFSGKLFRLSLVQEYFNRKEVFVSELIQHVLLVTGALIPSLILGGLLGLWAFRRPVFRNPIFSILNLLQTIPSVAMFGLLMAPLAALTNALPSLKNFGIHGVGAAPAIIALTLYALLPIARNTLAGFLSVPRNAIDAGHGMGMTPRQIIWNISIPLALPTLLAGIRIVIVQLIGLTVVAGLIGAGGLGTFVFQGIGQTAPDLVLLGVLPVVFMALFADLALGVIIIATKHA